MLNTWKAVALCAALALAQVAHGASPDAIAKAREAVRLAELAMVAKDYPAAAERMEEAFRHDPNPLWLANAGYARMLSGQQDRAVENLSKALNDARLTGLARDNATERLARASAARAHLARSDEARSAGDLEAAARALDEAFQQVAVSSYPLEAGLMWERAGLLEIAEERFKLAARQDDLTATQRRDVAEALVRVAKARAARVAPPEPEPAPAPLAPVAKSSTTTAWVLVVSGAAVTGLGIAGFALSEADQSEFHDAARDADGNLLMTRARAEALQSSATTWLNVGVVATAVGGAALVTGIVLLVVADDGAPETRGDVHVGGTWFEGGGLVTASGRF